jgi:hypothetical protein
MIASALALLVSVQEPLTAEETRDFMMKLARYVEENHLKKDPKSEQRGMTYEYFDTTRKGQVDQWVQGEGLDTMHDGAWFGIALVEASRATGDATYKEFLTQWTVPFYCKMLNHSDTLFSAKQDDVAPKGHKFGREHQLQEGEKGFVPYWWDDGASVSLERRRSKILQPDFSSTDRMAGKPNPNFVLDGWSHGSSNHLAQDLGVFVQQTWLLFRESDPKLAAELAEAAKNLYECRMRHHGHIPACDAAAALTNRDKDLMKRVPEIREGFPIKNHYGPCLVPPEPAKPQATPGFADDDEYEYYWGIARSGGELPKSLAFHLIYDAFTHPLLIRYYSDNAPVAPGMNRFDLHPFTFVGGKPSSYRSTREIPLGSRFGPQNMVVCGWALQAMKRHPGLWEERYAKQFSSDLRVRFSGVADSEPVMLGNVTLRLGSARNALLLSGTVGGERATIRVFAQPDAQGTFADLALQRDGSWTATNGAGDKLLATVIVKPAEGGCSFEAALPYTVAKDQKPWANGIEHARYTISVGDARRNVYLASGEADVERALRRELGEGLRTWRTIFVEKGYIPTGTGAGWVQFSDTGGYAHLLSAGAQWLEVLDGRRNWELHKVPRLE